MGNNKKKAALFVGANSAHSVPRIKKSVRTMKKGMVNHSIRSLDILKSRWLMRQMTIAAMVNRNTKVTRFSFRSGNANIAGTKKCNTLKLTDFTIDR